MGINKEKTVAFVGLDTSEILSGRNDANLLNVLLTETYLLTASLYQQGFRTFISGMSDGFEKIAAEAVQSFQREKEDVELIAVQPGSELRSIDCLLANCSQLVCCFGNNDNDTIRIFERAKTENVPLINLYTLLTDYLADNSPAKQALQPYNNIDGFRYCKEGILLCYLYGEKPIITPFENIASVEKQEDKIYVTLINGLEVDAYILTE